MGIFKKEIAHLFWHGAPLSLYENACLKSFLLRGFEVNIWAFDDLVISKEIYIKAAEYFNICKMHVDRRLHRRHPFQAAPVPPKIRPASVA